MASPPTEGPRRGRRWAALYWRARRPLDWLEAAVGLLRAASNGLWLGLLDRDALHRVDELYYDGMAFYHAEEYNRSGLLAWEQNAVERHFAGCRSLLVLAAGGGREVLALRGRGLEVDGFECHPDLRAVGSRLLVAAGGPPLAAMGRDVCPPLDARYDGVVVGWGAYMLIQGRERRVALLTALRAAAADGAPLLLSFFPRRGGERTHRVGFAVARAVRRLLRRPPPQLGDSLQPNFVHLFTAAEVEGELAEAGWRMVHHAERPYGHAVAVAS